MITRKIIICFVLLTILTVAAGCAGRPAVTSTSIATTTSAATTQTTEPTPALTAPLAEEIYIPVVSKGFQHKYWQVVMQGAERAAADYNVRITYEGPTSEQDVQAQINLLEQNLEAEPAALCLAAIDTDAVIPSLLKYKNRKLPIVAFDSGLDTELFASAVCTDNLAAGRLAGHQLASLIGGEGLVFALIHDQTSLSGSLRRDGFLEAVKEYPDIQVMETIYASDRTTAADKVRAALSVYPEITGIFAANEGTTSGMIDAVSELMPENKVHLIGFDSGKYLLDAIRSGLVDGAITQHPYNIGYEAVKAAVMLINEQNVPSQIESPFRWYTAADLSDPLLLEMIYE